MPTKTPTDMALRVITRNASGTKVSEVTFQPHERKQGHAYLMRARRDIRRNDQRGWTVTPYNV